MHVVRLDRRAIDVGPSESIWMHFSPILAIESSNKLHIYVCVRLTLRYYLSIGCRASDPFAAQQYNASV